MKYNKIKIDKTRIMKRIFVLLIAVATMVGCVNKEKNKVVQKESKVLTKSAVATSAVVELVEEFTSEIEPHKENAITPAASGVHIAKILFDVGDRVRAGQVVATLDPTQYNRQLVSLKIATDDYNRLLPVYKAGGISEQQIDQAKAQLDIQQEIADNLKMNIQILSPITGVVTARNYESGDLFAQQPILHIMQIDVLKVRANVSERDYPNVKMGMPVEIKVDVFPNRIFEGKVSLIYPALDPTTRTFQVEIKVPNAAKILRPGMFARAVFNMGEKSGVMIPDVAIQKQVGSSERFVYIVEDGVAKRRTVKLGRQVGSEIDILSGVSVGEEVAITAFSKLSDEAKVEVKKN